MFNFQFWCAHKQASKPILCDFLHLQRLLNAKFLPRWYSGSFVGKSNVEQIENFQSSSPFQLGSNSCVHWNNIVIVCVYFACSFYGGRAPPRALQILFKSPSKPKSSPKIKNIFRYPVWLIFLLGSVACRKVFCLSPVQSQPWRDLRCWNKPLWQQS